MRTVLHLLNGLEVGGKERVALQLAQRAAREGFAARFVLFDTPFRSVEQDFDPGPIPVQFLPRGRGVDLRFAAALAQLLRELRLDVVHAHNDSAIFYACVAARLVGRRQPGVCATFHVRPGHATRGGRLMTRLASRRAGRVTAVSAELAEFVVRAGWAGRCETLWNGVDLEEFSPRGAGGGWRERLGIPPGVLLIAHIGRADPIKRQADLVLAARELAGRGVDFALVLVGRGFPGDELQSVAAADGRVRLVPRVVDVAAFLREVDVFVLCSSHEAAPRVLLEAMACGRAIVATRVGGIVDMLRSAGGDSCGVLVEPGRPAELAAALLQLAGDPQARAELGRRARARAADFSADEEWHAYRRIYEALLP
jgi:L-malate glycosyltransferase